MCLLFTVVFFLLPTCFSVECICIFLQCRLGCVILNMYLHFCFRQTAGVTWSGTMILKYMSFVVGCLRLLCSFIGVVKAQQSSRKHLCARSEKSWTKPRRLFVKIKLNKPGNYRPQINIYSLILWAMGCVSCSCTSTVNPLVILETWIFRKIKCIS